VRYKDIYSLIYINLS